MFVRHAHYSAVLSPFGKPEVSLEPYRRWHAIFRVSKNFTRVFTQFHAIFTQFGLFQPFLGQFQHVGYQNACTPAEKFIGNTFMQFHPPLHAVSRNFTQFSRNLGYFSHFRANFNMLAHLDQLTSKVVIHGGRKPPIIYTYIVKCGRKLTLTM